MILGSASASSLAAADLGRQGVRAGVGVGHRPSPRSSRRGPRGGSRWWRRCRRPARQLRARARPSRTRPSWPPGGRATPRDGRGWSLADQPPSGPGASRVAGSSAAKISRSVARQARRASIRPGAGRVVGHGAHGSGTFRAAGVSPATRPLDARRLRIGDRRRQACRGAGPSRSRPRRGACRPRRAGPPRPAAAARRSR